MCELYSGSILLKSNWGCKKLSIVVVFVVVSGAWPFFLWWPMVNGKWSMVRWALTSGMNWFRLGPRPVGLSINCNEYAFFYWSSPPLAQLFLHLTLSCPIDVAKAHLEKSWPALPNRRLLLLQLYINISKNHTFKNT